MNSIALFGGSFDPVHLGHVKMLEYALDHFDFNRIDIIPTQVSPFKEEIMKFYHQDVYYQLLHLKPLQRFSKSLYKLDTESQS